MKDRIWRFATVLTAVLTAVVALAIVSFAMPIPEWRTGELPAPPLPIVEGGPAVHMPNRIWIDTDAACGYSRTMDPDDCFALLLLARARGVEIAGTSTVFGNAPIEITDRTTRDLVEILEREGAAIGQVHRGAGHASGVVAPEAATPVQAALREALDKGPLTIVALGPLTNIAAALADRPDLQRRVARLVVVMGRRSGHLFHPSEGAGGGMLFGHGPVFRDFNFDQDRNASRLVLAMNLPVTLVPYVAAREVSLTGADLAYLEAHGGSTAWVAARARGWLAFWEKDVGKNGFYPFDVLAGAYALQPSLLSCAETKAWVSRDDRLWGWFYGPEALLVGVDRERPSDVKAVGSVLYCPKIDSRLHAWMMPRLTGESRTPRAHDWKSVQMTGVPSNRTIERTRAKAARASHCERYASMRNGNMVRPVALLCASLLVAPGCATISHPDAKLKGELEAMYETDQSHRSEMEAVGKKYGYNSPEILGLWEKHPPSSLLQAHAPVLHPPHASGTTLAHQVFAGRCQPRLGVGPSRRYLCGSFPACLDLYPGGSCGAYTRFFPQDIGLPDVGTRSAPGNIPTATSVGSLFRGCSHSLTFRPAGLLAHPDCSYRSAYTLGSRGFYVRAYHGPLPPRAPDMLTVRFGQLTVRELRPLKIRSLVGCSPNAHKLSRGTAKRGRRLERLVYARHGHELMG